MHTQVLGIYQTCTLSDLKGPASHLAGTATMLIGEVKLVFYQNPPHPLPRAANQIL